MSALDHPSVCFCGLELVKSACTHSRLLFETFIVIYTFFLSPLVPIKAVDTFALKKSFESLV